MPHTAWTLEVVDAHGNSTVWDDEFGTDQAALDEVIRAIRDDGIASLIGEPRSAPSTPIIESDPLRVLVPLSEDELDELDAFLLSDATSDETMLLDHLDGYLTAIVVGPTSLNMSQWYSGIWGGCAEDSPHFETMEKAQRIMQMIMRHYNGIIWSLDYDADTHEPLFDVITPEDQFIECIDAEMWSVGFMEGLALCRADWQPLFDDSRGIEWLTPIRLLGGDDLDENELAQVETSAQREELAAHVQASVAAIYRFWLPHRRAKHELQQARAVTREHPKIGRNDPCPCGSGKKFKKCCGAGPLH
ncbi:MAG: UPF0149 family protein [Rhodocyclaceae bacterium]|nr:UPF0149 family protein [Rhodocyclaceae bacterium]